LITDIELDFFDRISPVFGSKQVEMPLPEMCPDCRQQRRQMFRNDRVFYRRKCDLSGKPFISLYPQHADYRVFSPAEWYGERWNPMDYGRGYDFNKPFFQQFAELMREVPRLGIDIVNCENSDYCNYCGDDKDCYLDIAGEANRDCYFNLFVKYSKDVVDSTFVYNSELCYESINCYDCYNVQNSIYCDNCSDTYFSFDLKGCRNCVFCHGLRNKEYYIFNKAHSPEEYESYVKKLYLGSFENRGKLADGWDKYMHENAIFKFSYLLNCENCSGDNLKDCKKTSYSFNASTSEDCRYLYDVLDAKDCQDLNYSLYKPELSYNLISTLNMVKSAFSMASHYNNEVYYCDLTNNSANLFGCIGLKHKQYCILNKQYSKEEYEDLVPKIIEHMNKNEEWGQFFPVNLSPFAYNETVAVEYYPMTEEEAKKRGWKWKDGSEERGSQKHSAVKIPDDISGVNDDICKQTLVCEVTNKPYKIIQKEFEFYKKMNVPIPRRCPDQRHKDRTNLREPRKLWERKCSKCGNLVMSVYAPNRSEKIYCEECYMKEVY